MPASARCLCTVVALRCSTAGIIGVSLRSRVPRGRSASDILGADRGVIGPCSALHRKDVLDLVLSTRREVMART